ncbi:transposase family protein [Streptomyces longispororuber]|uniref:transposase family protein n=1 Tax=Streptomyces longispororuber TaxID=68230 RepID=UPI0035AB7FB8
MRPGGRAAAVRLVVCAVEVDELLPRLAGVSVVRVDCGPGLARIVAVTRDDVSRRCPGCGQWSNGTHSRYGRRVADEAVGGRPVVIALSVRRSYCENLALCAGCLRRAGWPAHRALPAAHPGSAPG